ncbi:hypothetical protein BV898_03964 [Hypsibius exemplaris]|uniref:Uncharacterized protein n=1 Tax=Hypsibius exemplaris TaxID=2072580 RepID=A0A1W0X3W8_HYPEX|nr:hypothetical protein BV898_03964 [Hypsibius exemplaris]
MLPLWILSKILPPPRTGRSRRVYGLSGCIAAGIFLFENTSRFYCTVESTMASDICSLARHQLCNAPWRPLATVAALTEDPSVGYVRLESAGWFVKETWKKPVQ